MIRILLADDHPAIRLGLRRLLENTDDLRVVGEAENHNQVRSLVAELRPDVLLLDVKMPGPPAHETERWLRKHYPEVVTLVLTGHDKDTYLAYMMDAGAAGYLTKEQSAEKLIGCIRRAARGETVYEQEQILRAERWRRTAGDKLASLSPRERRILAMLAKGMDTKAIAKCLEISCKTVDVHINHVLEKLRCDSRLKAVAWVHLFFPDGIDESGCP